MYSGQLVFSQVMTYLPLKAFSRMVAARRAQHKVQDFTCLDQFLVLAFAQLTTRESLRDIEINLRAQKRHFYHMGLRCKTISRNTLANANRVRPWEVFADLAHHLIATARTLYANEPTNAEFKSLMGATVYALDSTTIDLCLSLFSWAPFRTAKAAIKLHTLIDLKGSIPSFIHISDGKMHDVQSTRYPLQARLHRGWRVLRDGQGLRRLCKIVSVAYGQSFLCEWAKDNLQAQLVQEFIVDTSAGLISDRHVRLTGLNSAKRYPEALRCVRFTDPESNKTLEFLTNNFALPAITICALYKQRWQVELFFKWIKQHLRIKSFYGTTENAVKTQVWIAISTYVLIAIMKKRLNLQHSLYEILRVLDLNMFEIVPIADLLGQIPNESQIGDFPVQQDLFQTLGH